jgi:hypothetical protein
LKRFFAGRSSATVKKIRDDRREKINNLPIIIPWKHDQKIDVKPFYFTPILSDSACAVNLFLGRFFFVFFLRRGE